MRESSSFRYFDLIMAAFVAVLLISNVASNKIVQLGIFPAIDGGTVLFPLSYIFADVLTEVYGFKRSRRVIWIGFAANLLLVLVLWLISALPAAAGEETRAAAFDAALATTPYIVLGSLLAYLAGEFSNSIVLAKLKVATAGRMLWLRTIGSTLIGQLVDTLIFVTVAFGLGGYLLNSPMPGDIFWSLVISNYVIKVGVEVVLTPFTYAVVGFLKRAEGVDVYDSDTDFNPFSLADGEQRSAA